MLKKSVLLLMSVLLVACQSQDDKIRIATKPMTEQFIIAEMLAILIEQETGTAVEITKGIGGGTANIHPAMLKGEFDLYPEYTGTAWLYVLKNEPIFDQAVLLENLKISYQDKYNFRWVGMYGFDNTFGLAVRSDYANANQIATFSQLAPVSPNLTFGAEYDFFERDDGYQALSDTYGYHFKNTKDLDIGLKYQALNNGQIDVVSISTTDGALTNPNLKVLTDDRAFYTHYHAGTVVRQEALQKYPKLESTLMKMDGLISEPEMAQLNDLVENQGQNERKVAQDFLRKKSLLTS